MGKNENDAQPDGFTAEMQAEVSGTVQHHPPCVPECTVCHPEQGKNS